MKGLSSVEISTRHAPISNLGDAAEEVLLHLASACSGCRCCCCCKLDLILDFNLDSTDFGYLRLRAQFFGLGSKTHSHTQTQSQLAFAKKRPEKTTKPCGNVATLLATLWGLCCVLNVAQSFEDFLSLSVLPQSENGEWEVPCCIHFDLLW